MLDKLKEMAQEFDQIDLLLQKPETLSQPARYAALMKRRGSLSRYVTRYRRIEEITARRAEARAMAENPKEDEELRRMAREEDASLQPEEARLMAELEQMFLDEDKESDRNAIVEIRAGAGGEEAALFAGELFRMYVQFAQARGWTVALIDENATALGGYKYVIASVSGDSVYKHLRYESGTHRVQRVPATEASGRIHTSTVTVAVLPEAEELDLTINPADVEMELYCRSSGPGGQNVNKVATAVRLLYKPTGLVVECATERSQAQNRELAFRRLRTVLREAELARQKSQRDSMRREQIGTGDRSEKIRTYNFHDNRVTDHRIGFTTHNLSAILEGKIDPLVQACQEAERALKLKALSARPAG